MSLKEQSRCEVRTATRDEFAVAVKWAEDEGWNPGIADCLTSAPVMLTRTEVCPRPKFA